MAGEGTGPVLLEDEGVLKTGDQFFEGLVCPAPGGQRPALDERGQPGEPRPTRTVEQGGRGDIDAHVHGRRTDAFGEVFEEAGGLGAGGAGVEAVVLVDFTDRRSS
ncbi:hypothetical protein [Streptomyces sp. MMS24-I29]|uniref:hypothetical protein n=1 Tax=Streptomyces sp. MMS24-I29 TaxID=3351480 RepID=UPI003C7AAFC2